ncbi:MAG: urease accessory protein UreD [Pelistega sp.]|nr:urease accessory protein UreD [Pelistega sp.]
MYSKLSLSTQLTSAGRTELKDLFVSPPFKVMTLPYQQKGLEAIQMSASPGLLAGDRLLMEVYLAEGTTFSLRTQAYTRVQSMNESEFAEQESRFILQPKSCFIYLPHPLVLHKDSAFKQRTVVEMGDESQFLYGEIVTIGRVLNNERFMFREFSSYLRIVHQGVPLLSDRIKWGPHRIPLNVLSQMEDYSHQGTLVFVDLSMTLHSLKEKVAQLQTHYADFKEGLLGISLLHKGGFIVRVTAYRADVIESLFAELAKQLKPSERD